MDVLLVTAFDTDYEGHLCAASHAAYARRHGHRHLEPRERSYKH